MRAWDEKDGALASKGFKVVLEDALGRRGQPHGRTDLEDTGPRDCRDVGEPRGVNKGGVEGESPPVQSHRPPLSEGRVTSHGVAL